MSDFPSELCRDILLRLPAVSLFRFRSVCKAWQCMIDDPSFIKDHTDNQVYSHTLLVRNRTGDPLFSISLDSLNFTKGPQQVDAFYVKQLIHQGMPELQEDLFDLASCNGLILISHRRSNNKMWTIWNPLTGECHRLPLPNVASELKQLLSSACGLGYDRDTGDYKVVNIIGGQTLVYSLKSESWSMTEGCPCFLWDFRGTFWNGALYWRSRDAIVALDLGTGRYFQLPRPPVDYRFGLRLDALDGCLICSVDNGTGKIFYEWVVKEKGVWNELFLMRNFIVPAWFGLKLVAYLKGKEQLILQYHEGFLWLDIRNNSVLKFSIHDLPHIESSVICPGSLVRLGVRGGATAGRILTRKRKRDAAITHANSLKLCVRDVRDKCC